MWYLQVVNSSKTCSLLHLPLLCADLIETASNKQKDMVCIFILYIQTPQFRICFTAAIHQECLAHIKSSSWTLAALHATFLSIKNQRWSQNTLNYMHLTILHARIICKKPELACWNQSCYLSNLKWYLQLFEIQSAKI